MAAISLWLNVHISKTVNARVSRSLVSGFEWRTRQTCWASIMWCTETVKKNARARTRTRTHALPPLRPLSALPLPLRLHNNPPITTTPPHLPLPGRPCPNQTQQINNSACRSCHGINYAQRVSFIRGLSAGCPWHVSGCPCISAKQR